MKDHRAIRIPYSERLANRREEAEHTERVAGISGHSKAQSIRQAITPRYGDQYSTIHAERGPMHVSV